MLRSECIRPQVYLAFNYKTTKVNKKFKMLWDEKLILRLYNQWVLLNPTYHWKFTWLNLFLFRKIELTNWSFLKQTFIKGKRSFYQFLRNHPRPHFLSSYNTAEFLRRTESWDEAESIYQHQKVSGVENHFDLWLKTLIVFNPFGKLNSATAWGWIEILRKRSGGCIFKIYCKQFNSMTERFFKWKVFEVEGITSKKLTKKFSFKSVGW